MPRFMVEFIRTNPKILFQLSQAQVTAIVFIIAGIIMWIYSDKKMVRA